MSESYVIGIDLSLAATGVATHDGKYMVIKDSKVKGEDRLTLVSAVVDDELYLATANAYHSGASVLVVIEDLPSNAMGAGLTGKVQGVVRQALGIRGISYLTVPPSTLKKYATGNGTADKKAMVSAWNARGGVQLKDDNMVDAAFLRQFGKDWLAQEDHRALYDSKVQLVEPGNPSALAAAAERVIARAVE